MYIAADDASSDGPSGWRLGFRLVFGTIIVSAAVAGYAGLRELLQALPADAGLGTGFWNVLYYDLQLFVLGSDPLQAAPGPYGWALDYARFAAPAATVYALFEAGGALFVGRFHRWRIRHGRGHAIVTGTTTTAHTLVAALREERRRGLRLRRRLVVHLDDEVVTVPKLRAAGVRGAATVYACGDDRGDATLNVAVAQLVTAGSTGFKGKVYAHVSDPRLTLALRARWLAQPEPDRHHVDYFNVEELAARTCLRSTDFPTAVEHPLSIMIVGWGGFAQALVVEYAHQWRFRGGATQRLAVRVVGARQEELDYLRDRWDVVRDSCDLVSMPTLRDALEPGGALPHRAFICYDDEDVSVQTALIAHELWRGGEASTIVRLNRVARSDVLDTIGGRLRLISVTQLACRSEVIAEDLTERVAQAIHRMYLREQLDKGVAMRAEPAMVDWAELAEGYREGNRDPARKIGLTLTSIGATVAPCTAPRASFAFSAAELERLAMAEHVRWSAQRIQAKWRYGPTFDEARKHHPSLVPWEKLPDSEREKDREAVRNLVRVLGEVGLQIVRLGPPPHADGGVSLPRQASVNA